MYNKVAFQALKKEFWIEFSKTYPRKWILYDTKIKDFSFKFYADNKIAQVLIDIEHKSTDKRIIYYEKLLSLKTILVEEYIPELFFERDFVLENGKIISRVGISLTGNGIGNKNNWQTIFDFFYTKMDLLEMFFYEYQDYISDLDLNT